jgi:hypothetical protein
MRHVVEKMCHRNEKQITINKSVKISIFFRPPNIALIFTFNSKKKEKRSFILLRTKRKEKSTMGPNEWRHFIYQV